MDTANLSSGSMRSSDLYFVFVHAITEKPSTYVFSVLEALHDPQLKFEKHCSSIITVSFKYRCC